MAEQIQQEMKQISSTCTQVTVEERPPGSLALDTSMMLPLFNETRMASDSVMNTFRNFCYNAEPNSVVVYQNQMLIDTQGNRQMNLFGRVFNGNMNNLLMAVGRTVNEFRERQDQLEENQEELKETVKVLQKEVAELKQKQDKRKKRDAGSINKVNTSYRVTYSDKDGKRQFKCITEYKTDDSGNKVKRTAQELYKFARNLGLTDTAINRAFNKLRIKNQL